MTAVTDIAARKFQATSNFIRRRADFPPELLSTVSGFVYSENAAVYIQSVNNSDTFVILCFFLEIALLVNILQNVNLNHS